MAGWNKRWLLCTCVLLVCSFTTSCNLLSGSNGGTVATPTPTTLPGGGVEQPIEEQKNPCEGLSGALELQLLVGPSEAVGLTPYTFATIPFTVVREGNVFLVRGNGPVAYYEDVLEEDWGTYTVQFEGEITVSGTCVATEAPGVINFYVQMDGEQMIVVVVEGMEHTYPWVGMPSIMASFPILDKEKQSGEGWVLELHIDE